MKKTSDNAKQKNVENSKKEEPRIVTLFSGRLDEVLKRYRLTAAFIANNAHFNITEQQISEWRHGRNGQTITPRKNTIQKMIDQFFPEVRLNYFYDEKEKYMTNADEERSKAFSEAWDMFSESIDTMRMISHNADLSMFLSKYMYLFLAMSGYQHEQDEKGTLLYNPVTGARVRAEEMDTYFMDEVSTFAEFIISRKLGAAPHNIHDVKIEVLPSPLLPRDIVDKVNSGNEEYIELIAKEFDISQDALVEECNKYKRK